MPLTSERLAQTSSKNQIPQTFTNSHSVAGFTFYLYNTDMGFTHQRELGGYFIPKSTRSDLPAGGEKTEPDPSWQPGELCDVDPGPGLLAQSLS